MTWTGVEVFVEGRAQPALHSFGSPILRMIPSASHFLPQFGKMVLGPWELFRGSKELDAISECSFEQPVLCHPVFQDFIDAADERLLAQSYRRVVEDPAVAIFLNVKCDDLIHFRGWV